VAGLETPDEALRPGGPAGVSRLSEARDRTTVQGVDRCYSVTLTGMLLMRNAPSQLPDLNPFAGSMLPRATVRT